MSEEDRSRLYAWLREHADEPIAEYMMSCLAPAPLADLVTKEHLERVLSAAFSEFALNLSDQRDADRKQTADQREADRKRIADQRDADRKRFADEREADRRQREADRKQFADEREADRRQREADRKRFADEREADRKRFADECEADRQEARRRHRWLVGIAVVLALEIVAAEAGWLQPLTDLLAAAF